MKEAIKREQDDVKLKELNTEIANLAVERDTYMSKWKLGEKEIVEKIQQGAKANIEKLKQEAEQAERNGDMAKLQKYDTAKVKEQEASMQTGQNN